MQTRKLGAQKVSCLGLGCMGMSEFYGTHDDEQSLRTLDHALDLGITFFDTSNVYGPFTNEALLGRFFSSGGGRRGKVVLATKFGIVRDAEDPNVRGLNSRPRYIRQACEASLLRLGTDHIDLYYQHRVDPQVPIEDVAGTLGELVGEGKIRHIGLSEAGPQTIRRAHKTYPVSALQTEYSLWSREPEEELLPLLRELGIGFVAYSPLGRGFLTGAIQKPEDLEEGDYRRSSPRFQGENFRKNLNLVARVQEIARQKGCTPAQLALAWLLQQGEDIVPIPGTRNPARLEENAGAATIRLSGDELDLIAETFPDDAVSGDRYPESMMPLLNG